MNTHATRTGPAAPPDPGGPTPESPPSTPPPAGTATGRLRTVLRLHRAGAWAWTAFVTLTSAALVWLRFGPLTQEMAKLQAKCDASPVCGAQGDSAQFQSMIQRMELRQFESWISDLVWLLRDVIPVAAALAGAAMVARELRNGTAELAWTQSVGPARWLVEKLTVTAALLTAGTGLLVFLCRGLLGTAGDHHLLTAGYETNDHYFAMGPSVVAYALLGLSLGCLAALLVRSPLLALGAAGFATWGAAWVVNPWRTQLWPTVTGTVPGNGPFGYTATPCRWDPADFKYSVDPCLGAQPASHYWPVQLAETGGLLVLALLVVLAALRRLRHRTG